MAYERFAVFASSFVDVCVSITCVFAQTPNDRVEQLPYTTAYIASDQVPATYHLSLAEAKTRVLENSIVMELATTQIAAKRYTTQAAEKDSLPKLLNSFSYFHFDSALGAVVRTPGIFNPATAITV